MIIVAIQNFFFMILSGLIGAVPQISVDSMFLDSFSEIASWVGFVDQFFPMHMIPVCLSLWFSAWLVSAVISSIWALF